MKLHLTALFAVLFCFDAAAQTDSILVMFWNVENFFDTRAENRRHFDAKCNAISKTILMLAEEEGRLPDAVGFAEVGDAAVMRELLLSTPLRKLDYSLVHFESPDRRGIDCALIYRRSTMSLKKAEPKHLYDSDGHVMPTRDILLAEFDALSILVNHHPSKVGEASADRRTIAMDRMLSVMDSLQTEGSRNIISVGDFNDTLWPSAGAGTIKYNGRWEKIDGCFVRGFTSYRERILSYPMLSEEDRAYGGTKPRRTASGPRYLGGVSDHYPIAVVVEF